MPPKKKQDEIDLSTLPQCKSINIFLHCKGRKSRSTAIIEKIHTNCQKFMFHVTKSAVLDHAKEKGIYVDPESLTDKQKKDPKFMETVCTELTSQVLGKATQSYINNQNIKIRLEKKANADKPEQQQEKNSNKFDCIYIFDDYPNQTSQFEGLAMRDQNIAYVIAINPKISWQAAPQQPAPEDEDPDEPDEDLIQYRKLKEQESLKEQDIDHNSTIQDKITSVKLARRNSSIDSNFRNTVIQYIQTIINPYAEQESITQAASKFIQRLNQLIDEKNDYQDWKKDKKANKFYQDQKKQPKKQEEQQEEKKQQAVQQKSQQNNVEKPDKQVYKAKGLQTLQIINNILGDISKQNQASVDIEQEFDIQKYDFAAPIEEISSQKIAVLNDKKQIKYLDCNQSVNNQQRALSQQIIKNLKFPGINRFSKPQVPSKSQKLRKLHRSTFGQFLPAQMNFHDFQRKLDLLTLEACSKQNDQQRQYDFGDRIYEQQHDKQSLIRQINNALLFDQSTVSMKYNQNNDKLYLSLLYKNGPRRLSKKYWQNNWKVLPNFESWLKYFKQNETNLQNPFYYDIDYELIGNIQQDAQVYSTKQGGAIVHKKSIAANKQNNLLYCLFAGKNDQIFGVRPNQFYCDCQDIKLMHKKSINKTEHQQTVQYQTFVTFKDKTIIQLRQDGNFYIQKPGEPKRLVTKDGYTIIYNQESPEIYHPQGGISHPPNQYVNRKGFGLQNNKLKSVQILKRSASGCTVLKRDDNTAIVYNNQQQWIKFPDNTQYLTKDSSIIIEKSKYPLIKINKNSGQTCITYMGIQLSSKLVSDKYCHQIFLKHGFNIKLSQNQAKASCLDSNHYTCNLQQNSISQSWQDQCLKVYYSGKSQYLKGDKNLDPLEDQQNFTEQDVLPRDQIPPRLFIINNNNTGCELLNKEQLQKNFMINFNKDKQSDNQLYQKSFQDKQSWHGIITVPSNEQLLKKIIKPNFDIDLDVFRYKKPEDTHDKNEAYKVRSFILNQTFSLQDRKLVTEILSKQAQWTKQSLKDNNQYGNRSRNDPITQQKYKSNNVTINFRKTKQAPNLYSNLKQQAINIYQQSDQQKKAQQDRIKKQEQMRKKMSKKKQYHSNYPRIRITQKHRDQNQLYYCADQSFYPSYWDTVQGKKALNQMPDWIFRPKQIQKPQQLDPQLVQQLQNTMNRTKKDQQDPVIDERQERNQRYDTVQVNIEPQQQIFIKPSVFTQKQIDEERYAFEQEKKAYQYHQAKRKQFNVYGRQRKQKNEVPSLMRTQPVSQLNQKYLVTEAPVDKKIKISSMKNKLTSLASNMTQMRKQGPHVNLLRTMDKGNDYSKLLQKRTMMVQADLNDHLQRDILINPIEANFGYVKEGRSYELKITIKNEDVLSQRIILKKPRSIFCKVFMRDMGPIALGMTRQVTVTFKASPELAGKFTDQFDITTKHEIYHIPIIAHVCSESQFNNGRFQLSKTIKQVKQQSKMRKTGQLPPINQK